MPVLYSNLYLRVMQFTYLLGMTVAAVAFAATATWCHGEIFTTIALFSISSTVWAVKAPLVVPVWSPGFMYVLKLPWTTHAPEYDPHNPTFVAICSNSLASVNVACNAVPALPVLPCV